MVHGLVGVHHGRPERIATPSRPDPDRLLTVKQVAERLSVSPDWVYRQLKAGTIGAVRVGAHLRVTLDALDAYLAGYPGIAPPAAAASAPAAELEREVG